MKNAKRILSFILALCTLVLSLVSLASCGKRYTDEEAREILAELLEKEVKICKVIYGEGLKTREDPGEHKNDSTFYYMEVASDSEYIGLSQLKEAVKEVYATDVLLDVWEYAFGSDGEEEKTIIPRYAENDGYLQIDVTNEGFNLKNVAYIGESSVKRVRKNMIEIDIKISSDGESFRDKTLVLKNENGVWKLDTQSWCVDMVW